MAEEELNETLASLASEGLSESSKIARALFSSVSPAEEDAQGRVVLPANLRKMAGIEKDIVTLGVGNRIEIWAAEKYYEYMEDVDYDAELEKLRI
jgi:MraZ protein